MGGRNKGATESPPEAVLAAAAAAPEQKSVCFGHVCLALFSGSILLIMGSLGGPRGVHFAVFLIFSRFLLFLCTFWYFWSVFLSVSPCVTLCHPVSPCVTKVTQGDTAMSPCDMARETLKHPNFCRKSSKIDTQTEPESVKTRLASTPHSLALKTWGRSVISYIELPSGSKINDKPLCLT